VNRDEAERLCIKLAREHPNRGTHSWVPREEADGGWSVIRIAFPPPKDPGALAATTEERPKPPAPDDPRRGPLRDVPPFGGA
jgi:hypothetical protein